MAQNVNKWLKTKEAKKLLNMDVNTLVTKAFFRDPLRRVYQNPSVMYSPADGIVLYAYSNIGPNEPLVEVKGVNFTVRELLNDKNYNSNSLVVGVFMSSIDVHINRIPTDGHIIEERDTPFIYTHNISMYALEYDFFSKLGYNKDNLNYLFCNEKKISTVMRNKDPQEYYLVQIADKDINVIINWADGAYLQQGERFGMIRWGSQVDLIIPLEEDGPKYKILTKPLMHVEAGVDKIVGVIK